MKNWLIPLIIVISAMLLLALLLFSLQQNTVLRTSVQNEIEPQLARTAATDAVPVATSLSPALADQQAASNPIAQVNGQAVDVAWFHTIVKADAAINRLLAGGDVSTIDAQTDVTLIDATRQDETLQRMVNGELVRQAAAAASYSMDQITVQKALAGMLAANARTMADLQNVLTDHDLTMAEFDAYFTQLLLADRFTKEQADSLNLSVDAYLGQLRQAARISFSATADTVFAVEADADEATNAQASSTPGPEQAEPPPPDGDAASGDTALDAGLPFADLPLLSAESATRPFVARPHTPTLLSFWTTWCPYCRQQVPVLTQAFAQASDPQALQFIGINVKESAPKVQQYVEANDITYPILLDEAGTVAEEYAIHGYPTTLFLNAQGEVIARHVGALTEEKLANYLNQLLPTEP